MEPLNKFLELSNSIAFSDLDQKTVTATKEVLLDFFGALIGGTGTRAAKLTAEIATKWGGPGQASIFSNGIKVPIHAAVMSNCTAGRALDYDDVHEQAHLHATVAVVPPALALSESSSINGKEFIVSIVLGFEILARMGLSLKEGPGKTGFSTTYQGASLAAAYTGARLLNLDINTAGNAIGIAYSQAAGNQQVIREGVDMMFIQQGLSGMSGMIALEMAQAGITGPREVFCGYYGYFPIFHPDRYNIESFTNDLGQNWAISSTSIKPFPCCKLNHTALQACLNLRTNNNIDPNNIRLVRVGINKEDFNMICEPLDLKRNPKSTVDAVFSIPYVLSCGLLEGKVTLNDFTADAITRENVIQLASIIEPVRDEDLPKSTPKGIPAWVEITLVDGTKHHLYQESVPGSPTMPIDNNDRLSKFFDCISFSNHSKDKAVELLNLLDKLEQIEDVSSLIELCINN